MQWLLPFDINTRYIHTHPTLTSYLYKEMQVHTNVCYN